ncbi:MAG: methyltransferase domain-containing protein [Betaproteobacteria bacterium]|nr:methyltransferase domain-containing protein [Betaproteobacteria bacterium]
MAPRDPHRFINELDDAALERLIVRLESRARDDAFARLLDKYLARLAMPPGARVLEVGCGTGAVLRALARRDGFDGEAVGVDHCQIFVDTANRFAQAEGVADKVAFKLGDAHRLDFPMAAFDVVIAHTVISHLAAPLAALGEMARVVRPGGSVVIFDGDYASLTYAFADHDFGNRMDAALANATFNNPRVMRDLPRLLPEFGLKLDTGWGDAVVEIGRGSYFKSFAETYVPYVKQAGGLPEHSVEIWLDAQRQAMANGTFFAACNYYTYLARRV